MLLSQAKQNQLIRIDDDKQTYHVRSTEKIEEPIPDRIGADWITIGVRITLEPVRIRGRTLRVIGERQHRVHHNEAGRKILNLPETPNPPITVIGMVEYQPVVRLTTKP